MKMTAMNIVTDTMIISRRGVETCSILRANCQRLLADRLLESEICCKFVGTAGVGLRLNRFL